MQINLVKNYIIRALDICQNNGFKTICSLGLDSTTKNYDKGLNKFCNKPEYNIVQIRRDIAKDLIKCEEYPIICKLESYTNGIPNNPGL